MKLTIFLKFIVLFFSIFGILGSGNPVLAQSQDDSIGLPDDFMERWRSVYYRSEQYRYNFETQTFETVKMNFPPHTDTEASMILETYECSGDFVEDVNPLDNLISFEDTKVALQIFQKNKNFESEIQTLNKICLFHVSDMNVLANELIKYCEKNRW